MNRLAQAADAEQETLKVLALEVLNLLLSVPASDRGDFDPYEIAGLFIELGLPDCDEVAAIETAFSESEGGAR